MKNRTLLHKLSRQPLVFAILLALAANPLAGASTSTIDDAQNDVARDIGDDPFAIPVLAPNRDYMDILEFSSSYNDSHMEITYLFASTPDLDMYYSARFEGSTGNTEGPDFDIDALDSIASIIFEVEENRIQEARFYDADSGEDETIETSIIVDARENQVTFSFPVPSGFLIEEVFNQENLEIIGSILDEEDGEYYYDNAYLGGDGGSPAILYLVYYGRIAALLVIVLISFIVLKRKLR